MKSLKGLALLVTLFATTAFGQHEVPAGGVVWNAVAQVYFDPNSLTGQAAGYFTYFPGIDDLFVGAPNLSTARFTFRSDTLQLQPLSTPGDLSIFLTSGGVWKIYYNSDPSGDWTNLDSFSRGQLVATLTHGPQELIGTGAAGTSIFSGDVIATYDFVLDGRTYNLGRIFRGGFTNFSTISNVPATGTVGFPVGLPYASSAIARAHNPD